MQNYSRRWRDAIFVLFLVKSYMSGLEHMLHSIKTNLCFVYKWRRFVSYLMWAKFCFMVKIAIDKLELFKMTCAMNNLKIHRSSCVHAHNEISFFLLGQTNNG